MRNTARSLALAVSVVMAAPLAAQDPVGGAVPLPTQSLRPMTRFDSLLKPPLSPRRAFLTSLVLPGAAQSRLNRPTASIIFASVEIFALGMARKSAQDVREAERAPKDSIVAGYTIDPTTGVATPTGYIQSRFTPGRVRARHLHYEDWIATLFFNHIIAGADAYVAAHLWDFKTNVSMNVDKAVTTVALSIPF